MMNPKRVYQTGGVGLSEVLSPCLNRMSFALNCHRTRRHRVEPL